MKEFIDFANNRECFSQLGQDLFVLYILKEKRGGYFVEFGATDGISLNNTRLLEKNYGWSGILCEPSPYYAEILKNSDRSAHIDDRCVYINSGEEVVFIDTDARGLATIKKYADGDSHSGSRAAGIEYFIQTITLDDLLNQYGAPPVIDYMSVDTEGSEFDILNSFSFSRHINIMTVEHNYREDRQKINDVLTNNGFVRIFEEISRFDDWYINKEIL